MPGGRPRKGVGLVKQPSIPKLPSDPGLSTLATKLRSIVNSPSPSFNTTMPAASSHSPASKPVATKHDIVRQASDDEAARGHEGDSASGDPSGLREATASAAMARVIAAHADPSFYGLAARAKADRCGMSLRAYYDLVRCKPFRDGMQEAIFAAAYGPLAVALDALGKSVALVGAKGSLDRKILFQMTGLLNRGDREAAKDAESTGDARIPGGIDLAERRRRMQASIEQGRYSIVPDIREGASETVEPEKGDDGSFV
jgi:hypothetical protein